MFLAQPTSQGGCEHNKGEEKSAQSAVLMPLEKCNKYIILFQMAWGIPAWDVPAHGWCF